MKKNNKSNLIVKEIYSDLFEKKYLGRTKTLVEQRRNRINQLTGRFHEELINKFKGCREDRQIGICGDHEYDVINDFQKLIAEIQNCSHMKNGDSTKQIRHHLTTAVNKLKGYIGYQVVINRSTTNIYKIKNNVYMISGKCFYKLMTGDENFFEKLYQTLRYVCENFDSHEELISSYCH